MKDPVDVAIVGAGPYGLSLAAHLRRAGISYRQFGLPMHLWQAAMPRGMFLKSQGFASNLSDPDGTHTLAAFCKATSRRCRARGIPVRRVISRPADRLRGFPQIPGREGGHAAG